MNKISAVLITLNEEENLRRTLSSLDFCDEIVVVDSGSTDNTIFICKEFGCKTHFREFDDFGSQKRFAVSLAVNNWVLSIDADEVVTPDLKRELLKTFSGPLRDASGYYLPRTLIFMGKALRFSGEHKRPCLRLFDTGVGSIVPFSIHEGVVVAGKTAHFKGELLHYSYSSISDYLAKFNSYTSKAASSLFFQHKKTSLLSALCRIPLTFVKIYLFRGGLFDGFPGFLWSLMSALYPFVKYVKLLELNTLIGSATIDRGGRRR